MNPLTKGAIVALLHAGLVSSLGAKLLYDRATRPRVWIRTAPYDPSLPIRGRYVSLQLQVEARGFAPTADSAPLPARLSIENERLLATPGDERSEHHVSFGRRQPWVADPEVTQRYGLQRSDLVEPQLAKHLGIAGGVFAKEVRSGSALAQAGLQAGDVLLRIDGQATTTWPELSRALQPPQGKQELAWDVLRGHQRTSLKVSVPASQDGALLEGSALLAQPVLFFIPEHVLDPARRPAGEELWVELTVPKQGPPRPVRLGVKKGHGPIEPLAVD